MSQSLLDLSVDIVWLTTWCEHAHPNVGTFFGWPEFPFLDANGPIGPDAWQKYGWKLRVVADILQTPGPPVIWVDDWADNLIDELRFLSQSLDISEDLDPHGRLFVVCPDSRIGLTRRHLQDIMDYMAEV